MRTTSLAPIPVKKALQTLGNNLKEARIKRRITMALLAERAGVTMVTLAKIEKGDAAVSLGIYAKILFILGLLDNLNKLADPTTDTVGKMLEEERLPKRVRLSSKQGEKNHDR